MFEKRKAIYKIELLKKRQLKCLNIGKIMTNINTKLSYINKLLKKFYLLQKLFILNTHFFIYLII